MRERALVDVIADASDSTRNLVLLNFAVEKSFNVIDVKASS